MRKILQSEASECALACLAMIADHFGYKVELSELRRRFSVSMKGATLQHLLRHASAISLSGRPLRLELHEIGALKCPSILHWDLNHFVVLKSVKGLAKARKIIIYDPAVGERVLSFEEVSRHFTGIAIEFLPTEKFEKRDQLRELKIRDLAAPVVGLRRALFQVFALSLALEIFAIVSPLFNQFVIDDVVVNGDAQLLKVLVLAFGLLIITQTAIDLARSWFLMRWSIDIGVQWTARVFSHMLRLPVSYFEKRHLGDILSRFGSISSIQGTLTGLLVESGLDGLMAVFALAMMLLYSVKLTVVVLVGIASYSILRWIFYGPLREASRERLTLASRESTYFLETLRAITPLKLFRREAERLARWQNYRQDVINRDIKTQKLGILFKISSTVISSLQALTMFYIGAGLVMEKSLTVGMLTAFASYSSTFSGRVFSLIDVFINVRMLSMHSDRLADIVMEPAEHMVAVETNTNRIEPSITLRSVKFRYAEGEPWVLNGVDLHIPAGQSIALVGSSGCGKTTLCKIILGLLAPNEGEVLIDGIPIVQLGLPAYRDLVGTVMQDDVLLAGSILDNICFFDTHYDTMRVEFCAKLAAIHDEICMMPMGYQTVLGDLGSSLSGGQKQRVLLARALYKKPKILALDEATSHLDVCNERKVNAALREMKLTRIMVAHRPETIQAADRIVTVSDGRVVEAEPALALQNEMLDKQGTY